MTRQLQEKIKISVKTPVFRRLLSLLSSCCHSFYRLKHLVFNKYDSSDSSDSSFLTFLFFLHKQP